MPITWQRPTFGWYTLYAYFSVGEHQITTNCFKCAVSYLYRDFFWWINTFLHISRWGAVQFIRALHFVFILGGIHLGLLYVKSQGSVLFHRAGYSKKFSTLYTYGTIGLAQLLALMDTVPKKVHRVICRRNLRYNLGFCCVRHNFFYVDFTLF